MECDTSRVRANAVQQDIFTQAHISSSMSRQLTNLIQTLDQCQILLCLQETDLKMREAILVEEQEHGLHPSDGRYQLVEQGMTQARVDRANGEHAVEARQLSL
jgi:hypothetical protein